MGTAKTPADKHATDLKRKARAVVRALRREFPEAHCALEHRSPFQLLISTILSAQCTDKMVNKVTAELYKDCATPRDFLKLTQSQLERRIRPTGFYKNKAKNILACCRDLINKYDGRVPATMEELTGLAGVGRKTANVVLGNAFGIPGLVVDTHVTRITNLLGLTRQQDAVKIEFEMRGLVPEKDWTDFAHLLISHGRKTCVANRPLCAQCFLARHCDYFQKNKN